VSPIPVISVFDVRNGVYLFIVHLVRGILGLLNALALLSFRNALQRAFGRETGNWYILLQASQFHVIYYASRTLPNMYAFALSKSSKLPFVVKANLKSYLGLEELRSINDIAVDESQLPWPNFILDNICWRSFPL
jgi:hypothetical protein